MSQPLTSAVFDEVANVLNYTQMVADKQSELENGNGMTQLRWSMVQRPSIGAASRALQEQAARQRVITMDGPAAGATGDLPGPAARGPAVLPPLDHAGFNQTLGDEAGTGDRMVHRRGTRSGTGQALRKRATTALDGREFGDDVPSKSFFMGFADRSRRVSMELTPSSFAKTIGAFGPDDAGGERAVVRRANTSAAGPRCQRCAWTR